MKKVAIQRRIIGVTLALAVTLCALVSDVHADAGLVPISYIEFSFEYQAQPSPIRTFQLLGCSDDSCSQTNEGSSFTLCQEYSCVARGLYEFPTYRLVIGFADKARESGPFTRIAYNAKYTVTVRENGLSVREVFSLGTFLNDPVQRWSFVLALPLTLVVELVVAALYSAKSKLGIRRRKIAAANLISLPIVWFVFPLLLSLPISAILVFVLSELFAVAFEALFMRAGSRTIGSSPVGSFVTLSLLMNCASVVVGLILLPQLA